jgi:hypothetical protein
MNWFIYYLIIYNLLMDTYISKKKQVILLIKPIGLNPKIGQAGCTDPCHTYETCWLLFIFDDP